MSESCLVIMKNSYNSFSVAEKRIADFIFSDPEKVMSISVGQLAKDAGVAASTVVRMCKNLGYSGFSQFKLGLSRAGSSIPDVILPAVMLNDTNSEVFAKVFDSSIRALQDTLGMLDVSLIDAAIELFNNAKSIQFYGVGTSATIAMDAYYRFMRIGLNAFYSTDNHIMRISSSSLNQNDVAVGISHCGATIDTVEALRIAKNNGAKTIAITSSRNSPICKHADIPIIVYSDEIRYPMEAVSARIAHIAVLDAFCVALSLKDYDKTIKHTKEMNQLFRGMRIK